jgi:hypothetical protein
VLRHPSNQRVLRGPQTSQGMSTPGAKDEIEVRGDPDRQLEDTGELTDGAKLTRGVMGIDGCVGKGLKVGKGGYIGVNNDEDEEDNVGEFGGATGVKYVELDPEPVAIAVAFLAVRLVLRGGDL